MTLSVEANDIIVRREAVAAFLIEMVFVSETKRVWTGFGKLRTVGNKEWDGLGEVIRIEGLGAGLGPSATPGRLGVSGVSTKVIGAAVNATEYKDRPILIYLQPFQDRALYGAPVPLQLRFMKSLEISRSDGTRSIAVNHEGPYTGRRRPAAGWYSFADQQKRSAGDLFCERVFDLLFKQDRFRDY